MGSQLRWPFNHRTEVWSPWPAQSASKLRGLCLPCLPCRSHQKRSDQLVEGPRFDWIIYWLVVWNMAFIFPYIGSNNPNWLSYSEGLKPPTSLCLKAPYFSEKKSCDQTLIKHVDCTNAVSVHWFIFWEMIKHFLRGSLPERVMYLYRNTYQETLRLIKD